MHKRRILAPLAAGTIGLTMAFGTLPAMADTVPEPTAVSYSNLVLNIGATDSDRNFVWYSSSDSGQQQVRLQEEGVEDAVQLLDAKDSGTSKDFPELTWRHAGVTGLKPGTTYTWEVGSEDEGWSDAYEFTTQDDDALDVLVFGDTQIGSGGGQPSDREAWQDTLNTALESVPNPDFLLSVGDQVNTHDSADEYADYLAPDQLREHALATNIGNHDDGSRDDEQHSYTEHFNMPHRTANPGWNNEMGNYWYIQDDVLFVSLNSNHQDAGDHEKYVRDVVAEHGEDVQWKVATWHHSLYSTASHATDGDIVQRREWMPSLMTELDFDVVFSGHDHVYNRSNLLYNGHPVNDAVTAENPEAPSALAKYEGEVLYMTMQSSTGSKYYNIQQDIDFTFNAVESQNRVPAYAHLSVDGDTLSVTNHQVDGTIIDEVALTQNDGANPVAPPEGIGQTAFRNEGPLSYEDPVATVYREDTDDYLVEGRILNSNDDVEEGLSNGGELDMTSSDLELVHESPGDEGTDPQNVGIRFSLLDIPVGAEITSAHVQFTVDEPHKTADPFDVTIHAEDTGHAAEYDEFTDHDVSSRDYLDTLVDWTDAPVWTTAGDAGEDQRTPDISELIQAVVNGDDWEAGNSLALMLTGEGTRTAESHNGGGSDQAPKLMVTYQTADDMTDKDPEVPSDPSEPEVPSEPSEPVVPSEPSEPEVPSEPAFEDNDPDSAFFAPVQWMAANEISVGYADGTFKKTRNVSRGETTAFLFRYLEPTDLTAPQVSPFTDVNVGGAHFEAISWAEAEDITAGFADGTFRPSQAVTRGQFAAFLYGLADPEHTAPATSPFGDLNPGGSHYAAVTWLAAEDITVGDTQGDFNPSEPITRGQISAFLQRYDRLIAQD